MMDEAARILERLLDLTREEREALLQEECGGDPGLEATVRQLLGNADSKASWLNKPAIAPSSIAEAVQRFLQQYQEDQANGARRPLEDYQKGFPGLEAIIQGAYESQRATQASHELEAGSEAFGPYRIVKELGRGGQGAVYLAHDTRLGSRPVALKVLKGFGPGAKALLSRFEREANIAGRLNHPGLCSVYGSGMTRGVPWIAMEYVEGQTVAEQISSATAMDDRSFLDATSVLTDPESEGTTATQPRHSGMGSKASEDSGAGHTPPIRSQLRGIALLIEKAARAIHTAHEAGIIHRDIKPGNMMVTPEGRVVVLDFGLARDEDGIDDTLTRSGDLMGTPAYMSPEQIAAQRVTLDRRTDVYSLGVVLFECLTLKRPFESATREGLYQAILTKDAPDIRKLNSSIFDDLRIICETALEKDRDRRYQTALHFAEDLRRFRELEPIHAKSITRWVRFQRWVQRNPGMASALTAAATFLIVGTAVATAFAFRSAADATKAKQAGIEAENQARNARLAENEAKNQTNRALRKESHLLVYLAEQETARGDTGTALCLALEALPKNLENPERPLVSQCWPALRNALAAHREIVVLGGHEEGIRYAAWSPKGERLLTQCDQTTRFWHPDGSGKPVVLRNHPGLTLPPTWSPDGTRILGPSRDAARIWNADGSGEPVVLRAPDSGWRPSPRLHPGAAAWSGWSHAAWSPDGTRVLGVYFGTAVVWNADGSGEPLILCTSSALTNTNDAAWSPDSTRVAIAFGDTVRIEDPTGSRRPSILSETGRRSRMLLVAWSPDGTRLLAISELASCVWNADGSETHVTLSTCDYPATKVRAAWSRNGTQIATYSDGQSVGKNTTGLRIWLADGSGDPIVVTEAEDGAIIPAEQIAWSSSEDRLLLTLGEKRRGLYSQVYPALGGRRSSVFLLEGQESEAAPVWSPDGARIALASGGLGRIWRNKATDPILLGGHQGRVTHVSWSPDGTRVLTASQDKTARIWRADSAESLRTARVLPTSGLPLIREARAAVRRPLTAAQRKAYFPDE